MYCKECGAKIEDGKFCSECGTNINSTKQIEGSKTKKLNDWESVALLLILPFILYIVGFWYLATLAFIIAVIYVLYNDHQSKSG